jgi:phage shock protein C
VIVYLLAALIMKPEPAIPVSTADEREFYERYTSSRHDAAKRLRQRYETLEKRIRRMEDTVTSRAYGWEKRMGR